MIGPGVSQAHRPEARYLDVRAPFHLPILSRSISLVSETLQYVRAQSATEDQACNQYGQARLLRHSQHHHWQDLPPSNCMQGYNQAQYALGATREYGILFCHTTYGLFVPGQQYRPLQETGGNRGFCWARDGLETLDLSISAWIPGNGLVASRSTVNILHILHILSNFFTHLHHLITSIAAG